MTFRSGCPFTPHRTAAGSIGIGMSRSGETSGFPPGMMAMLRVRRALRFRLRTLLLWVLLTGVALGAERARRRQEYLGRAAYHAAREAKLSAVARLLAAELARYPPELLKGRCGNPRILADALKGVMTNHLARVAEHGYLKERYLQAAARPWEPVPGSDPLASTSAPSSTSAGATGCPSP
jgi:hypothetical protein